MSVPDGLGGVSGGGGLAPFDQHPADPAALEDAAGQLERLANRALDQDAATASAFDPAVRNWDGVAAPELRAAGEHVRALAGQAASAVAWGARPLRYWAAKVSTFNLIAAEMEAGCALELAPLNRPAAAGHGSGAPIATELNAARAEVRARWHAAWRTAHDTFIVEGASETAAMYRDGPTEENLARLTSAGVTYGAGAPTVFAAMWHQHNMREAAGTAVDYAERILASDDPSEADLRGLADLLSQYADDDAFAYYLLAALGPERLLTLTADVALIKTDTVFAMEPDGDLAALVGTIQTGLGVALGAATVRRGRDTTGAYIPGGYELSAAWIDDLMAAGRTRIEVDGVDFAPWGYQALGVLLRAPDAGYDANFLADVGVDMLAFERGHDGSWSWNTQEEWVYSDNTTAVRLNWIDGFGTDARAGLDPVAGLMVALDNDPDAARRFLTAGGPDSTNDRVDYLMHGRDWIADLPLGPVLNDDEANGSPQGLRTFGSVLTHATATFPDRDAVQIAHAAIRSAVEHGLDPALRQGMAGVLANSIDSVYWTMEGHDDVLSFDEQSMRSLLEQVGRDDGARNTVADAAIRHLAVQLDSQWRGTEWVVNDGATHVARGTSEALRALDHGASAEEIEQAAADQEQVDTLIGLGREVIGLVPYGSNALHYSDLSGLSDVITGHLSGDAASDNGVRAAHTKELLMSMFWTVSEYNGGPANPTAAAALPDTVLADDYRQQANEFAETYTQAAS